MNNRELMDRLFPSNHPVTIVTFTDGTDGGRLQGYFGELLPANGQTLDGQSPAWNASTVGFHPIMLIEYDLSLGNGLGPLDLIQALADMDTQVRSSTRVAYVAKSTLSEMFATLRRAYSRLESHRDTLSDGTKVAFMADKRGGRLCQLKARRTPLAGVRHVA